MLPLFVSVKGLYEDMENDMISIAEDKPRLELNKRQASALLELVVGDKIGSGVFRDVYAYAPDPENWVLKIAKDMGGVEHNTREYLFYRGHSGMYDPLRDYFAHIEKCDDTFWILKQRRIQQPLPNFVSITLELPCTGDLHRANVGYIDGKPVIFDLGYARLNETPQVQKITFSNGIDDQGHTVPNTIISEKALKKRFDKTRERIAAMIASDKTDQEILAKLPLANIRLIELGRMQHKYDQVEITEK